jgi:hypothetical protein
MFSAGFESTVPVIEDPQTHTVDGTVTGNVKSLSSTTKKNMFWQTDLLSSSAEREGRGNNLLAYNRKNQSLDHSICSRMFFSGILNQGAQISGVGSTRLLGFVRRRLELASCHPPVAENFDIPLIFLENFCNPRTETKQR